MAMRMSGLASGLDIDGMVKAMLQPQQNKIDSMFRKKTLWGWKQEAYNNVNAKLAKFVLDRKADFGISNTTNGVTYDKSRTSVTWLKTATVTNRSSASGNILTATASTTAGDGKYKVNVKQVADNWSAASGEAIEQQVKTKTVDGTVVAAENTINNMFDFKDGDVVDFTIETNKGKVRVVSTNAGLSQDEKDQLANDGVKLVEIDMSSTTLQTMASKITAAGVGVSASFDTNSGRFFIQTSQTGEANTIKFTENSRYATGETMDFIAGRGKAKLDGQGNEVVDNQGNTVYEGNLLKLKYENQTKDENGNVIATNLVDVMSNRTGGNPVYTPISIKSGGEIDLISTLETTNGENKNNIRAQLGIEGTGQTLKFSIEVGGKTVTVGNDASKQNDEDYVFVHMWNDSLEDLVSNLNTKLEEKGMDGAVTASFTVEDGKGKFSFDIKDTGVKITDNSILYKEAASGGEGTGTQFNFLMGENSLLGLKSSADLPIMENNATFNLEDTGQYESVYDETEAAIARYTYAGQDAIIDFGVAKDIKQSSNDFSINGINLSIKNVGETEVQISTDVSTAIDKIKKFVDEYNKLVTDLNSQLKSKYDKSYQPLLDSEKKEMSADQITAWEDKGKTGLLRNDDSITTMLNNLRTNMFEPVTGVREDMNTLYKIGINFDSYSTSAGGQLTVDEDKLREALLKDGNAVIDVLFKTQDDPISKDKKLNMQQSGAFTRMTNDIVDGMKSIINIAGTGNNETLYRNVSTSILLDFFTSHSGIADLQKEINTFTNSLKDLNTKFNTMQENYYKRYASLETAISNANSQSSWLSSMSGN